MFDYYIMHSDDMQVTRNLVHLVHNPHQDLCLVHNSRLGHMNDRYSLYSRCRNRRT